MTTHSAATPARFTGPGSSAPSGHPSAQGPVRIVLADGNPLYREGLVELLGDRTQYRVLAGVDCDAAALSACREYRPHLLLMELRLGGLQAPGLIEGVREACATTRVVAFSRKLDPPTVWRVLHAGADGLLCKDAPLSELLAAMQAVHRGGIHLCPRVQHLMVRGAVRNGEHGGAGRWGKLSRREREVAERLIEGQTPRQISEHLSLKIKTVDSHRYQLLQRLGLRNVADLTRLAVAEGVIQA